MTSVNITTTKNTVTVNGETRVVTVKTQGPQGTFTDGNLGDVTVSSNGTAIAINTGAVTSAKILDGTIVNADINASAAIAGTKISPDFGSQNIVTTGTGATGALGVTGNITVSGTVDGRDVAADGTKLDGIEANAINASNTAITNKLPLAGGTITGDLTVGGDFTVNGTTTTIDTTTLTVEDKNIELGKVSTPTDTTADGGGITLKGATDKTFQWVDATDSWTSSEHIALPDSKKLQLGAGQDLALYHNGSHSYIQDSGTGKLRLLSNSFRVFNAADSEFMIAADENGSVNLYYDNSKKFETTSAGATVTGDLGLGTTSPNFSGFGSNTGGLEINDVGSSNQALLLSTGSNNFYIANNASTNFITGINDAPIKISTNGSERLRIESDGNIQIPADNKKLQIGASQDLQLYHASGNSIINNSTGYLELSANAATWLKTTQLNVIDNDATHYHLRTFKDNQVELYYDNSKKFETTSSGIDVTGRIFGDTMSLGGTGTTYDALFQFSHNTAYSASGTNAKVAIGNANSTAATNSTGIHMFTDGNGRGVVNLNACNNSTNASADFVVQTRHNSTLGERLRITSDGNVKIPVDNAKLQIGASQDLSLYHNGTNNSSFIDNITGDLTIRGGGGDIIINPVNTETAIYAIANGKVQLRYDNSTKFETTSEGIKVTTDIQIEGGSGDTELKLKRTNTAGSNGNAFGSIKFIDENNNDISRISTIRSTAVDDGDIRFETRPTGGSLTERLRIKSDGNIQIPDNNYIYVGDGNDLRVRHDATGGNHSYIFHHGTGAFKIASDTQLILGLTSAETFIECNANDNVELYYDNSKKLETTSTGVQVTGNVNIATGNNVTTGSVVTTSSTALTAVDNGIAYFGTDLDLRIYHNGSDSFVRDQGTGGLYLTGSAVGIRNSAANEDALVFAENAAVQLFFDNVKKFETTSDGVTSNEKLKVEGDHILIDNDGDSMYRLSKNGTAVFSIRNNSTGGCHLNTQNDAILAFGVASGSSPGTVNSDLRIVAGGNTQISADNKKLQIGAGQDLELSHDGSSSYITNSTGFLFVQSNDLALRSQGQENFITAAANGSVELYYDNVKKFETTSSGVNIPDNAKLGLGSHPSAGGDLLIWHNGSDNFIDTRWNLTIRKDDGAETLAKFNNNGGVQLYYDNSNMLETINGGARVNGVLHVTSHLDMTDSGIIKLGDGDDLQIKHSGTDSVITHDTGSGLLRLNAAAGGEIHITKSGPETLAKFIPDGAVELYYDNVKRCETYSSGLEIVAGQQLRFPHANASDGNDGTISSGVHGEGLVLVGCRTASGGQREILHYGRIRPAVNNAESIGAVGQAYGQVHSIRLYMRYDSNSTGLYIGVDDDIRGYHDGTNSYFTNKTGNFYIGNTHSSGNVIFRSNNTDRWHIDGNGHFLPDANNTYDIGTTSNRVRNIYTNDLHLSNEGSSNDVDGTWGDWTIQEGESDLFLKNNRSGKKYKFNLTEVS